MWQPSIDSIAGVPQAGCLVNTPIIDLLLAKRVTLTHTHTHKDTDISSMRRLHRENSKNETKDVFSVISFYIFSIINNRDEALLEIFSQIVFFCNIAHTGFRVSK